MPPAGIDVTRYIALGDSVTSGYTDGALHFEGQKNAYVNLLARQFKLIGGGEFRQAFIDPDSVGIGFSGNSSLVLKNTSDSVEPTALSLSHLAEAGDLSAFEKNLYTTHGPFNNLGVPGVKITTLLYPGYGNPTMGNGNFNPFFTRMAADPAASSILSDALVLQPTFFTLFAGNNDAIAYALSGALTDHITPSKGPPGIGFRESFTAIVEALTKDGAKGAVANLPDILYVPFFTAIPYNGLCLDKKRADKLSSIYRPITFHEGKNPFLLETDYISPLEENDLVLYDVLLDKNKIAYLSGQMPLPKRYVLKSHEVNRVQQAISEFNTIIENIVAEKKLALVDVYKLIRRSPKDRFYNEKTRHMHFRQKLIFSLDGLHPAPLGQAVLANEFIASINQAYNCDIPYIKIS